MDEGISDRMLRRGLVLERTGFLAFMKIERLATFGAMTAE